ncbi:MAG: hypothetical protein ACI9S9_000763 [Planctomycetota bacterium]
MNAYLFRSLVNRCLVATCLLLSFASAQTEEKPPKPTKPGITGGVESDEGWGIGTQGIGGKDQRPPSKAALFRAFAAIQGLSADYTEDKYLSLLAVPLKSKGKLHFMQPGYLSRIVESPEKSKLTITASELRMTSKDTTGKHKEEVIDLRQSDRVRVFVTSLVQVFQGNEKALKQHYRIRYTPRVDDFHAWQLELKPLRKPLTQIMKKLLLVGRDKAVTRIELHEPNGDRTITKIVKVNPNRAFTVKEQKNIFGVTKKLKSDSKAGEKDRESKKAKTNKAGAPR